MCDKAHLNNFCAQDLVNSEIIYTFAVYYYSDTLKIGVNIKI